MEYQHNKDTLQEDHPYAPLRVFSELPLEQTYESKELEAALKPISTPT
jgi:hypothetical protein